MISKGEVITWTTRQNQLVAVMWGEEWWADPAFIHISFWDAPYPCSHRPERFYDMISEGEVITDAEKMDDLLEVMTGSRYGFEPRMFQCPVSGNRWEVNPSDVCEIQDGPMDGLDGEPDWEYEQQRIFHAEDWEDDVDESQEWHDFDPDC